MFNQRFQPLATQICFAVIIALAVPATRLLADALDGHMLFGINRHTGQLLRYHYGDHSADRVGTIGLHHEPTLIGIEASAYVPGNTNLFAFWKDPSDQKTKLIYVNTFDASAAIVGQDLGAGKITGATAVKPQVGADLADDQSTPLSEVLQHEIYAVQENGSVLFEINENQVVPSESYAAKVTVLGAAISYGGQYNIPVTVKFRLGDYNEQPFGDFSRPVNANVNDNSNPRNRVFPDVIDPATPISVIAKSWVKKSSSYSGSYNSHWKSYLTIDSSQNHPNVITLRDGDTVPQIEPFLNQSSIVDFLASYVDPHTNTMVLDKNQAIYLFELGTTDLHSAAADFQDLVVLVTLAKEPQDLVDPNSAPVAHLIKVDPKTGATEPVMPLYRHYDSLTGTTAERFYGNADGQLYELNPVTGTETAIGSPSPSSVNAMAVTQSTLWGFATIDSQLRQLDLTNVQTHSLPQNMTSENLGTAVFVRSADVPKPRIAYD